MAATRGAFILSSHNRGRLCRGILELLARFGYASLREVMYGFELTLRQAMDRVRYLERIGWVQKFRSHIYPPYFLCLTPSARKLVGAFGVSEEVSRFEPKDYRIMFQRHQRMMVKVYLALNKILGEDVLGWASEETLRRHAGAGRYGDPQGQRIWDGELLLRVHHEEGLKETWVCGVELELSRKSPYRYWRQFNALARQIYGDLFGRQYIPMMLFLYGRPSIRDHLLKHLRWDHVERRDRQYGRCVFYFGQAEEFLERLGTAPLLRVIGTARTTVRAECFNQFYRGDFYHVGSREDALARGRNRLGSVLNP